MPPSKLPFAITARSAEKKTTRLPTNSRRMASHLHQERTAEGQGEKQEGICLCLTHSPPVTAHCASIPHSQPRAQCCAHCTHWCMYTAGHLWPILQAGSFMSVHVSHITSCAGNAMYQKRPKHSTLKYPNNLPIRFKTRKCSHCTPAGPGGSPSSQNSPRASQPLIAQLILPASGHFIGENTLAFKITLKCPIATWV